MTAAARFWADLGSRDFAAMQASGAAARCIAVLPVAAIEQHGPHLPLSVDTVLVNGLMAAAVPHLPPSLSVLFLPTQAVGLSPEHARFAGTLTLKTDTILRLWTDIAECVAAAGVTLLEGGASSARVRVPDEAAAARLVHQLLQGGVAVSLVERDAERLERFFSQEPRA